MRANWIYLIIGASLTFYAVADEALSSDFLEFLGSGSQLGGQWIDPMTLHESPEVFAAMPTAKEETQQTHSPDHPSVAPPSKDVSTPPRNNDGRNDYD